MPRRRSRHRGERVMAAAQLTGPSTATHSAANATWLPTSDVPLGVPGENHLEGRRLRARARSSGPVGQVEATGVSCPGVPASSAAPDRARRAPGPAEGRAGRRARAAAGSGRGTTRRAARAARGAAPPSRAASGRRSGSTAGRVRRTGPSRARRTRRDGRVAPLRRWCGSVWSVKYCHGVVAPHSSPMKSIGVPATGQQQGRATRPAVRARRGRTAGRPVRGCPTWSWVCSDTTKREPGILARSTRPPVGMLAERRVGAVVQEDPLEDLRERRPARRSPRSSRRSHR